MATQAEDLPFTVEEWDAAGNVISRVLARACNVVIARGAYEAARRQYPDANLIDVRVIGNEQRGLVESKMAPESE